MKSASNSLARARPLLGTFVEIVTSGAAPARMETAIEAAFDAVARVHRVMSFHDPGSDVSRLNCARPGRAVFVDDWTYRVLECALDLHLRSRGTFNIAVAPMMQALGLLPALAQDGSSPTMPQSGSALELLPGHRVRLREAGRIDLGGIAKGLAVDRAIDVLRKHEIPSGLVNAGGDLAAFGAYDHPVAIRDPRDPMRLMCQVAIRNAAIASSGLLFDPVTSERGRHAGACAI